MRMDELFDKITGDFEGVGIIDDAEHPGVIIRHKPTQLVTMVSTAKVNEFTWDQLEPVLSGVREPHVLVHMTRVCGYFSRIESWGKSKIGELKGRITGLYGLEGDRPSREEAMRVANSY